MLDKRNLREQIFFFASGRIYINFLNCNNFIVTIIYSVAAPISLVTHMYMFKNVRHCLTVRSDLSIINAAILLDSVALRLK